MRYVNIRTMKASFSEYINSLDEGGPVLITNHGEPKAMLIPFTHWEQKHLIQLDEKALAEAIVSHTVEMQERIARRLKLRPNWKASDKHLFRD